MTDSLTVPLPFEGHDDGAPPTAHDQLREIVVARDVDRSVLINEFLTSRRPEFLRQAGILCRHFRQDRNTVFDDVAQIVSLTAFELIQEILDDPDRLDGIRDFVAVVKVRAKNAVGAYLRSNSHTPLSGMSSIERRRANLHRGRREFVAEHGREPTDEELIDYTNTSLRQRLKDPKRSGFLVSEKDLDSRVRVASLSETPALEHHHRVVEPERGLEPVEYEKYIEKVCFDLAARGAPPEQVHIAHTWLYRGLTTQLPTAPELADESGIPVNKIRSYLRTIKRVAGEVYSDMMGDMGVGHVG